MAAITLFDINAAFSLFSFKYDLVTHQGKKGFCLLLMHFDACLKPPACKGPDSGAESSEPLPDFGRLS